MKMVLRRIADYRTAGHETADDPRGRARNALAGAIRRVCIETLLRMRLPEEVAEDLTQAMLPGLLDRIERGEAKPGCEDAYVRTSARNRARDHFREQSGVRSRASLGDDPDEMPT